MTTLSQLKESIESMSGHHQVEILRLLSKCPGIILNENQNGTFINLSTLSEQEIRIISEYNDYVIVQQETITEVEDRKQTIKTAYFNDNDNKDIAV